jgi:hypothetical protein
MTHDKVTQDVGKLLRMFRLCELQTALAEESKPERAMITH